MVGVGEMVSVGEGVVVGCGAFLYVRFTIVAVSARVMKLNGRKVLSS